MTAATTVAERMTVTLAASQSPERKTNRADRSERSEIDDAEKAATVRSIDPDPRFAILMVRSAIKSVTDLAGKQFAIDEKQSASSDIRSAVAAAGAAEKVSEGQGKAIDRLTLAEVPAAVLAVVSREARKRFRKSLDSGSFESRSRLRARVMKSPRTVHGNPIKPAAPGQTTFGQ